MDHRFIRGIWQNSQEGVQELCEKGYVEWLKGAVRVMKCMRDAAWTCGNGVVRKGGMGEKKNSQAKLIG